MTEHRLDDGEKVVNRGGRPAALTPQHILLLREIVTRMPHATLDELVAELDYFGEVRVCAATIRRTLRALDASAAGRGQVGRVGCTRRLTEALRLHRSAPS